MSDGTPNQSPRGGQEWRDQESTEADLHIRQHMQPDHRQFVQGFKIRTCDDPGGERCRVAQRKSERSGIKAEPWNGGNRQDHDGAEAEQPNEQGLWADARIRAGISLSPAGKPSQPYRYQ